MSSAVAQPKAAGTPTTAQTSVSVGATFVIAGATVKVASQDISKIKEQGFKFALSSPVTLGTPPDLLGWINTEFTAGIDIDKIKTDIDTIPVKAIQDILNTFWSMSLIVEVLNVDTKAGLFEIAIMLQAETPPKILGVLQIESLGFGVKRIGAPDPADNPT